MEKYVLLLIIFIVSYFLIIFLIKYQKNIGTKSARTIFWNFIRDCFSIEKNTSPEMYPISFGIDALGTCDYDTVNKVFADLSRQFEHFYTHSHLLYDNRVVYYFKICGNKLDLHEPEIWEFCEHACNAIVHRHLQKYYKNVGNIENLICINIENDILAVSIAKNIEGRLENVELKHNLYLYYHYEPDKITELTAKWRD